MKGSGTVAEGILGELVSGWMSEGSSGRVGVNGRPGGGVVGPAIGFGAGVGAGVEVIWGDVVLRWQELELGLLAWLWELELC